MLSQCYIVRSAISLFSINRELHSWVQDHYRKEPINDNSQPVTISSSKSITIPSKTVSQQTGSVEASHQHVSRKVALLNRRQSRFVIWANLNQLCFSFYFTELIMHLDCLHQMNRVNYNLTKDTNRVSMISFIRLTDETIRCISFHSRGFVFLNENVEKQNSFFHLAFSYSGPFNTPGDGNKSNSTTKDVVNPTSIDDKSE